MSPPGQPAVSTSIASSRPTATGSGTPGTHPGHPRSVPARPLHAQTLSRAYARTPFLGKLRDRTRWLQLCEGTEGRRPPAIIGGPGGIGPHEGENQRNGDRGTARGRTQRREDRPEDPGWGGRPARPPRPSEAACQGPTRDTFVCRAWLVLSMCLAATWPCRRPRTASSSHQRRSPENCCFLAGQMPPVPLSCHHQETLS